MLWVLEGASRLLLQLSCPHLRLLLQHLHKQELSPGKAWLTAGLLRGINFSKNLISCRYVFANSTQVWQNEKADQHCVFLQNDYIIRKHNFSLKTQVTGRSGDRLLLLGFPDLFLPKVHNHLLLTILLFIRFFWPCTGEGHSPFRLALKLFCPLFLGILRGKVHVPGCGKIELTAFCPMEVDGVSIRLAAVLWTKGAHRRWCYIR